MELGSLGLYDKCLWSDQPSFKNDYYCCCCFISFGVYNLSSGPICLFSFPPFLFLLPGVLWSQSKEVTTYVNITKSFHLFFSSNCIVSGHASEYLIHFELISHMIWLKDPILFIYIQMWNSVHPSLFFFFKRMSFFYYVSLGNFAKGKLTMNIWIYLWDFSSIPLLCVSVLELCFFIIIIVLYFVTR